MLFDKELDKHIIDFLRLHDHIDMLNSQYEIAAKYLDNNFEQEIKSKSYETFHERWVELSFISLLLENKIQLINSPSTADIKIQVNSNYQVWIECTSVSEGDAKNNLNTENAEIPMEHLLPRITNAVSMKVNQHNKRIKKFKDTYKKENLDQTIIPILLINVANLYSHPMIMDEYFGLFEGWDKRIAIFNSPKDVEIKHIASKIIKKPNSTAVINTAYFENSDFPFQYVILSSKSLTSVSSAQEYYLLEKGSRSPGLDQFFSLLK